MVQGDKTAADRRWTYLVFRRVSVHVTRALLHTRVTPNQVTVASLVVAAFGLALMGVRDPIVAVGGCALLLFYHLLDRVDGELARYHRRYSLLGVYLDNAGHYLTGSGILVATAFRLAPAAPDSQVIWLAGSIGAVAAIMSRVEKHAPYHLFSQYVMANPELVQTVRHEAGPLTQQAVRADRSQDGPSGVVSMARDGLLTLSWFPVTVLILMMAFAFEAIYGKTTVTDGVFYAVAGIQLVTYLGVELANLSGNLGSESRRLSRDAGEFEDDLEE